MLETVSYFFMETVIHFFIEVSEKCDKCEKKFKRAAFI